MRWRDFLGMFLLVIGVTGCMTGIRGVTGDAWWGGPAIGVGAIANALAYRAMRVGRNEKDDVTKAHGKDNSNPPKTTA